ncbi:MAG TPA: tRNA (adenosine(37)-N6)-threonylcarbamoyltransferase complex ATPase subunit type 1 TsaE [Candidatus Sulfotelmatobacter sp.]|nr:tRNA (adenosine(37)-N6)-threonylcarbamoyltransferase complex ATPase subunit type 1 TsaE [Candidatus Sulfotelmatobacter sp.]
MDIVKELSNEKELTAFAETIGSKLKGGEVIELVSDLGGGKTTFTKGLVAGAYIKANVTSPSFNIKNEYRGEKFTSYHYDFYRLNEPGIMASELAEATEDKNAVVIVEWSDIVKNVLPSQRLTITITVTGENSRKLNIKYPKSYSYLLN